MAVATLCTREFIISIIFNGIVDIKDSMMNIFTVYSLYNTPNWINLAIKDVI